MILNEQIIIWLENRKAVEKSFNGFLKLGRIKKDESIINLVNNHFERAKKDLYFSNEIISKYEDYTYLVYVCTYYSAYHGALSLLAKKGYKSDNHTATLCAIIYFYYNKGLNLEDIENIASINQTLSKENIEEFDELKNKREESHYRVDITFEKIKAMENRKIAQNFLNKVEEILSK